MTASTYLITGTSRGIGLEFTTQLLKSGTHVIAMARDTKKSNSLVALKEKYSAQLTLIDVDINSEKSLALAEKTIGDKPIDVLINNAGVFMKEPNDFANIALNDVIESFNVNTIAPMRVAQAFIKNITRAKNPKIVNITSLMGSIADNGSGKYFGYRMSKAALNMFTKNLAFEFPKITSVCLHPGWVKTDMGGQQAPVEIPDSVSGMLKVINGAGLKQSGGFFNYDGKTLPW